MIRFYKKISPILCLILIYILIMTFIISRCSYKSLEIDYNRLSKQKQEVLIKEIEVEKETIREIPTYVAADAMSEYDFLLLCELIYLEAGSENTSDLDRVLVGNVALNRLASNYRSAATLEEVIYSPGQYSTASEITYEKTTMIPLSTALAAYRLAIGNRYCPNNVIYQSQTRQGDGVWLKEGEHYYCYENDIKVNQFLTLKEVEDGS